MKHYWSIENINLKNTCVTIGTFDGVHKGHQKILHNLTEEAKDSHSIPLVLTFFPHPAVVLGKREHPLYLTTPEEKAKLLGNNGAKIVITYPFTNFTAQKSASDFVREIYHHLQMKCLIIGHDFALGHDRRGNAKKLEKLGEKYGFCVKVIQPYKIDGVIVSSSVIRKHLTNGDVGLAALFLGRPYRIDGFVVEGDHRAQLLGTPTANLNTWDQRVQIKNGVYACKVIVDGQQMNAVTNIGVRPTFETDHSVPQIETHIINFDKNLYGKNLQIDFIARIRDEIKFPTPISLRKQIQIDIKKTLEILSSSSDISSDIPMN
ncbi:MAG: riboflavin biosynthesis protein RibF [Anaerolineales bacterium]|nr:riboflavin biosynthesis protein RibF [Anaerolineales bacterium]